MKLALTVASGSGLTFTHSRGESSCGESPGTVRTLVLLVRGTITRIENLAERIPSYLVDTQRDLEEVQKQLEAARQQMGQPFYL